MELLVINDKYTEEQLKVFLKHKIRYPKEGTIVELLRIENLKRIGKIGYVVSPFQEQYIIGDSYGTEVSKEVSFDSRRFVHLDGTQVTTEEELEFKAEQKGELERIEIKPKENLN